METLGAVTTSLSKHYSNTEDLKETIVNAALIAGAMDATASIFPGVAIPATIIGCFGAVWVMYGSLCKQLGISIKENTLKLIGKAVLANIAANLTGLLLVELIGGFLPGFSITASAVVSFITVYIAGKVFLKLILRMADKSAEPKSFSDISDSEMERMAKEFEITKEDVNEAKSEKASAS